MNKFLTKIIGASLAIAMMIGVGAGVNANKAAMEVNAATTTYSATTYSGGNITGTGVTWTGNNVGGSSYVVLKSGASLTSNGFSGIDLAQTVSFTIKTRTYGGSSYKTSTVRAYSDANCTTDITGTPATVSASGSSFANKTATLSFANNATASNVYFKITSSTTTSSNGPGISEISFTYTQATSQPAVVINGPSYLVDGGDSQAFTGTISNNNNYTITWSASDQHVLFNPATSSSGEEVAVSFNGVATGETPIEITATLNDANTATSNKDVYAFEHSGLENDPFTATEAKIFSTPSMANQSGGDWYVGGYVVGTIQTNKGYYIDEDPTALTSHKFEVYNSSGITNNTGRDIIVGTSYIIVHGSMTYYVNGSQPEMTGVVLVSVDNGNVPSISIDGGNRTVDINDNLTLTATKEFDGDATVTWTSSNENVATIANNGVVTLLTTGTTDITASMTVNATPYTDTITLTVVQNLLDDGDTFIIKATIGNNHYYLSGVANNLGTVVTESNQAMIFTAVESTTSGQFRFRNGEDYLSYSGNDAKLFTTTDGTNNPTLWTAVNNGTGEVIESVNVSGRTLQYNHNNGTNPRFACYTSAQTAIEIEKVVPPQVDEVTLLGDALVDAENAVSVTKEYLYEVTYVANAGTGEVNVSVVNSNSEEEGASVTSAPSGTSFEITFTASDTYTIIVTSVEDSSKSASLTVTVSNIYVPVLTDYLLYQGTNVSGEIKLTDGDYIIYYSGKAMKASINNGNRADYVEIEQFNGVISTDNANILWHIAQDGDYYTIFNASANKYLASGADKQAKLEATVTDNSRWSVEISQGTFEFINKAKASGTYKYLRNNTTYGFAVYTDNTGGALSLYKTSGYNHLNNTETIKTISGNESNGEVSNVALRFGAIVPVNEWTALKNAWGISEYGIMFARGSMLTARSLSSVEAVFRNDEDDVYSVKNDTGSNPNANGDNYIFTARLNLEEEDYNEVFYAVPYIVAGGNYYFLQEVHYSVRTLAEECYNNGGSSLSQTALATLKGNN